MRTLLIFCLLASAAAAPALSRPDEDDAERRPAAAEHAPSRDVGSPRESRGVDVGRHDGGFGSGRAPSEPSVRAERRERFGSGEQSRGPLFESNRRERLYEVQERRRAAVSGDGADRVRDWSPPAGRRLANPSEVDGDELTQRRGRLRRAPQPSDRVWDEGLAQPDSRRTIPREGTQAPARVARDDRHLPRNHWRGDWRRDNRYDWRRHRDRNRSLFRVGIYFDPFGWDYRRHHVGWRLWPDYYSRSYWLNDPWMYRLPQAFPGTRWIRYHGDAVLVDTWTGEVVDIIHDFFW